MPDEVKGQEQSVFVDDETIYNKKTKTVPKKPQSIGSYICIAQIIRLHRPNGTRQNRCKPCRDKGMKRPLPKPANIRRTAAFRTSISTSNRKSRPSSHPLPSEYGIWLEEKSPRKLSAEMTILPHYSFLSAVFTVLLIADTVWHGRFIHNRSI